jgi:predicted transcriptional regulator
MKKPKSTIKKSIKAISVKTGTVEEFFANVKTVMRAADKGKPIKQRSATLTFADPGEMLHFLSAAKIKLINTIRNHPDTITNIAKTTKRNRTAVYSDVSELEKFGLVKTHEEINPGHGRHRIVELIAPTLKLEAYI